MFKVIGLVAKSLLILALLLLTAWVGWRWGDRVFPPLERTLGLEARAPVEASPSPELANETLRRWDEFSEREGERELLVSGVEATSVLRHALSGLLPVGIVEPRVEFNAGGMKISGRVARDAFPALPELGGAAGILPDTVPMEVSAALIPFEGDETALVVRRIAVLGIPLPRGAVPRILDAFGRRERPGLPPEAVLLPLPDDVLRAYVLSDSLHLVGRQ